MTLFRLPRHRIGLFTISDRIAYWRRTGLDPYPLWLHWQHGGAA